MAKCDFAYFWVALPPIIDFRVPWLSCFFSCFFKPGNSIVWIVWILILGPLILMFFFSLQVCFSFQGEGFKWGPLYFSLRFLSGIAGPHPSLSERWTSNCNPRPHCDVISLRYFDYSFTDFNFGYSNFDFHSIYEFCFLNILIYETTTFLMYWIFLMHAFLM